MPSPLGGGICSADKYSTPKPVPHRGGLFLSCAKGIGITLRSLAISKPFGTILYSRITEKNNDIWRVFNPPIFYIIS